MEIEGLPVKHRIVSPKCHETFGIIASGLIALEDLERTYKELALLPENRDVKWHFVLTSERP